MTEVHHHDACHEEPHVRERHRRGPGRPKAIPSESFDTVLQLYSQGLGYRSIANALWRRGVYTTHTTVRRLLMRQGACSKARMPDVRSNRHT